MISIHLQRPVWSPKYLYIPRYNEPENKNVSAKPNRADGKISIAGVRSKVWMSVWAILMVAISMIGTRGDMNIPINT